MNPLSIPGGWSKDKDKSKDSPATEKNDPSESCNDLSRKKEQILTDNLVADNSSVPRSNVGTVNDAGDIVDSAGQSIGKIPESKDPQDLAGNTVSAAGDIVSDTGDVLGKATDLDLGNNEDENASEYTTKGVEGGDDSSGYNVVGKAKGALSSLTGSNKGSQAGGSEANLPDTKDADVQEQTEGLEDKAKDATDETPADDVKDQTEQTTEETQKKVDDTTEDAKDQADVTAEDAKDQADATAEDAKDQADATTEDAKDKADETAEDAQDKADEAKDGADVEGKTDELKDGADVEDKTDELKDGADVEGKTDEAKDEADVEGKTDELKDDAEQKLDDAGDEAKDTTDETKDDAEKTGEDVEGQVDETKDDAEKTGEELAEGATGEEGKEEEGDEQKDDEEQLDYSVLKGTKVNKSGKLVNEQGEIIGEVVEGNVKQLVGKSADANGIIWTDGEQVGKGKPLSDADRQDHKKTSAPFENFPDAVVEADGKITFEGKQVGVLVEGDAKKLKGSKVDEDGKSVILHIGSTKTDETCRRCP